MKFALRKANGYTYCNHIDCEENPKYFHPAANEYTRALMKNDVIASIVSIGAEYSSYCPDCTQKVYAEFKKVFASHLRAFL